ncbi:hypothetical protein [Pectobacterium polaris]|uniref:hypothetical protein n=1 Tax=Pectobacterium polaris TaxID=2042057 RepID=UPI001582B6A1|nr:hypothetical protein [Pectobacterium polaris]
MARTELTLRFPMVATTQGRAEADENNSVIQKEKTDGAPVDDFMLFSYFISATLFLL